MASDMAIMGVAMGAGALLIFAGLVWLLRSDKKDYKTMEMLRPLIAEAGDRPDEAKAIASLGAVKCDTCGFGNFAHVALCAVCGDAVGDASKKKKTIKRMDKQQTPVGTTSRAARAVRRNEWIRKSDVEGKFFWFRTATSSGEQQPGYVPHLSGSKVQWTEASVANSLDFSTGSGVVSGLGASALTAAAQPFPTKYTEFVERVTALTQSDNKIKLTLQDATHKAVFDHSLARLAGLSPADVRKYFIITYSAQSHLTRKTNTDTEDWHRDWFNVMCQHLVDEQVGLFTCVNQTDRTYFINPLSDPSSSYLAAGRFIGRALLHGDLMSFHLATPLLKILLGQPLSFHDLEHFDAVTYKSLSTLLSPSTDVSSLSLDFSVQEKQLDGSVLVVDLVPNGRNIAVTNDNKLEYLTRVTQRVLVERVSVQLHDLCVGFYEVVPQDLLLLFDAGELDYLLCGSDEIDVDDWQQNTKYDSSLFMHQSMKFFWEIVRGMPEDYKRRLLHFATGSTRVPVGGFAALKTWDGRSAPFSFNGVALVDSRLFKAEPCINRLMLPRYDLDKHIMKAVLYATLDPETYPYINAV